MCVWHVLNLILLVAASSKLKACNVISNWSSNSMADVAEAGRGGLQWLQTALFTDRDYVQQLVRQAEQLGVKAIVVTVDTPVLGKRLASIRNQFSPPGKMAFAMFKGAKVEEMISENGSSAFFQYASKLIDSCYSQSWQDLDWLRSCTQLPIILKGIMTAEDAEESLKHNIQGIVVSNHGGRQLDGAPATVIKLFFGWNSK